jgi:hypothetical protein
MFDQPPEDGGFEFRSGFVVNCHGRSLAVSQGYRHYGDIAIKWALSQILPYRGANRASTGRIFGCPLAENGPLAVDSPGSVTRNHQ